MKYFLLLSISMIASTAVSMERGDRQFGEKHQLPPISSIVDSPDFEKYKDFRDQFLPLEEKSGLDIYNKLRECLISCEYSKIPFRTFLTSYKKLRTDTVEQKYRDTFLLCSQEYNRANLPSSLYQELNQKKRSFIDNPAMTADDFDKYLSGFYDRAAVARSQPKEYPEYKIPEKELWVIIRGLLGSDLEEQGGSAIVKKR